jgi:hypothetical protein
MAIRYPQGVLFAVLIMGISILSSEGYATYFQADIAINTYQTRHFWNKSGELKHSRNHFKKAELDLYAQLSICPRSILSVLGSFSGIHDRLNGNTYGFGDVEANWTFQPFSQSYQKLWLNLTGVIPAGKEKESLRYGRWALEFDAYYSDAQVIFKVPCWYYFGLGYRGYFGFPSDQIKAIVNAAAAVSSNLFVYFIGNVEWGLFNGRRQEHFNQILYNPNYRLAKVEIGLVGYLTEYLYMDAGYFQNIWGANVGTGGGFCGGFGACF